MGSTSVSGRHRSCPKAVRHLVRFEDAVEGSHQPKGADVDRGGNGLAAESGQGDRSVGEAPSDGRYRSGKFQDPRPR